MMLKLADHILSPLGDGSAANYAAVISGASRLTRCGGDALSPEPFVAALFSDEEIGTLFAGEFSDAAPLTRFEKLAAHSIRQALRSADIAPRGRRAKLFLSTTKANISLLERPDARFDEGRISPAAAAVALSQYFGFSEPPLAVCNACISGVCAQVAAQRSLESGECDVAVVCGAEERSSFIIRGFQSLKALSDEPCRPFDAERRGLNFGEAAATIVYVRSEEAPSQSCWQAVRGAIRNDANHISGPSRTGEGSLRALQAALGDCPADELAMVSLHGTATLYNDEMESIALERAGLSDVPACSLKGTFGHTMGAAGVLETILSQWALERGVLLPTRGFATAGTSRPVNVSPLPRTTQKRSFIKLLSGFGGGNAAMLFKKTRA